MPSSLSFGFILEDEVCLVVFNCLPGFYTIGVDPLLEIGFNTFFSLGDFELASFGDCIYGLYLLSTLPVLAVLCLDVDPGIFSFGILTADLVDTDPFAEKLPMPLRGGASCSSIATRLSIYYCRWLNLY